MTTPSDVYGSLVDNGLDFLGDRVIHTDGHERLEYWKKFNDLMKAYPHEEVTYGRIYNLTRMCQVVVLMTIARLYTEGEEIVDIPGEFPILTLAEWDEGDWEAFRETVSSIAVDLIRNDASAPSGAKEDPSTHGERSRSELYKKKLDRILKYVNLHKALSPIRKELMKQTEDGKLRNDKKCRFNEKAMEELWKNVKGENDTIIKKALANLFTGDTESEDRPVLQDLGQLRSIMNAKPFLFSVFHQKLNNIMSAWSHDAFENPIFNRVYFPEEGAVQTLRRTREALGQQGQDPLTASIQLASNLGGVASKASAHEQASPQKASPLRKGERGQLLKKRPNATRLQFDDDEEEDQSELSEPDENAPPAELSELPQRRKLPMGDTESPASKKRKSQQKMYEGRRRWTDEEKRAVIEGVREKGKGNWAEIKLLYEVLLQNRTSGQIKDCYRTMAKRGELPAELAE